MNAELAPDTIVTPEQYGPGPWVGEPNRTEWRYKGLPCMVLRGPIGSLCGYVGVPPGHPWHGRDYPSLEYPEVHGGLTYSGECSGHICHVPQPGEPDNVWWLGFDCGHCDDAIPGIPATSNFDGSV